MKPERYSAAAIVLHWLIAFALAFQISLGWTLEGANGPALFARYQLHKSVGITILVLSLARLAIRLTTRRPAIDGPAWARRLAEAVHWAFYGVMIGAPLTGWIIVSTARIKVPTLLFGTIPLPHLPVGTAWHDPAASAHGALAWIAIGLVMLHIAGALRHQWLLGKPELQRMIPFARGGGVAALLAALALLATGLILAKRFSPDPPAAPRVAEAAVAAPQPAVPVAAAAAPEPAVANQSAAAEPVPLANWTVASGGRLGFTARWNGDAVRGTFQRWRATIRFSPDDLPHSRIAADIDLASATTGDAQRDESLTGSDFFDTTNHPRAGFTSNRILSLGDDRYSAAGTLDLHGVTRPVMLRFTLRIAGRTGRVTDSARIDRTSFGVGQGEWATTDAIAGAVDVDFAFTATRQGG